MLNSISLSLLRFMLNIAVILGSTRQNRFGEKPARWIFDEAKKLQDVDVQFWDLRDLQLPMFDSPKSPSSAKDGDYGNPVVNNWAKTVAWADAFVVVTPEYNHGTSAVLKNAFDLIFAEWNNKAVGFVSYGSAGGARAVEQLRLVAGELMMADVRAAVLIPGSITFGGPDAWKPAEEQSLMRAAKTMLTQLVEWGTAMKTVRGV